MRRSTNIFILLLASFINCFSFSSECPLIIPAPKFPSPINPVPRGPDHFECTVNDMPCMSPSPSHFSMARELIGQHYQERFGQSQSPFKINVTCRETENLHGSRTYGQQCSYEHKQHQQREKEQKQQHTEKQNDLQQRRLRTQREQAIKRERQRRIYGAKIDALRSNSRDVSVTVLPEHRERRAKALEQTQLDDTRFV